MYLSAVHWGIFGSLTCGQKLSLVYCLQSNAVKTSKNPRVKLTETVNCLASQTHLRCDKYFPVTWPEPSQPGIGHLQRCTNKQCNILVGQLRPEFSNQIKHEPQTQNVLQKWLLRQALRLSIKHDFVVFHDTGPKQGAVYPKTHTNVKVKVNLKVWTLIQCLCMRTSPQKCWGMALVIKGSHSFTCTPTHLSVNVMNHA